MKKRIYVFLLFVFFISLIVCYSLFMKSNQSNNISGSIVSNETNSETNTNTSKSNSIDKKRYIEFYSYASFEKTFNDNTIVFRDKNYSENEKYYGKVCWVKKKYNAEVISASQIVTKNKRVIYEKELEIIDVTKESLDNHRWDYITPIIGKITINDTNVEEYECYVRFIDANNIEYHIMLLPTEGYNDEYIISGSGWIASAVYVIDKDNNLEFWINK